MEDTVLYNQEEKLETKIHTKCWFSNLNKKTVNEIKKQSAFTHAEAKTKTEIDICLVI